MINGGLLRTLPEYSFHRKHNHASPTGGWVVVLVMDHAKAPDKGTTAREPITVFSMNRRSLTPERGDSASRVNASKPTKKQPELITWEEIIGKR